ncbi:hypothetical protein AMTRI_Chr04g179690 [Amborella trichopoda]
MFTPQQQQPTRKAGGIWPFSPNSNKGGPVTRLASPDPPNITGILLHGGDKGRAKGKGVSSSFPLQEEEQATPPPPPRASLLSDENGRPRPYSSSASEVWRHFREAGSLDLDSLQKKEKDALLSHLAKLEDELFDYQYNMGLLLIEKKEWTSKYDDLKQALVEAQESLKREQASHLIALSEVEKREENLRKALGVEKQCVADLENALHEMRTEFAEIKFTADKKLAEARSLVASIEEKSLEAEAKLRSADAQLAEASRKSSNLERQLQEIETRESVLRRERQSLKAEREAHETTFNRERENLRNWERKLKEGQERLVESQGLLNQREELANEKEMFLTKKEKDLEVAWAKFEKGNLNLKDKEVEMNMRLRSLTAQEEEAAVRKRNLDEAQQELHLLQEKLNAREKEGIQKLLDEHNAVLELRKREFDIEMDQKRKSLEEEFEKKQVVVEQKLVEVDLKEEKINKKEQLLEKRTEKTKEKEKDLELKTKSLKEKEKFLKIEQKDLDTDKKKMVIEKADLHSLKLELERIKAAVEEEKEKIVKEQENLKVTEDDKRELLRLQSELKQEIDEFRLQKLAVEKEREDLKLDKEKFEREWEVLDVKRDEVNKEVELHNVEKDEFLKRKCEEELKLKREEQKTSEKFQREYEALELQKNSFTENMNHERSVILQNARRERDDMIREFELQKNALESSIQNRREDMEKQFLEKERDFQEVRERMWKEIEAQRELAQKEMEEMKLERTKLGRERQEVALSKKHVEGERLEIQKDVEQLHILTTKLKEQREELRRERDRILSRIEHLKRGQGDSIDVTDGLALSELQSFKEFENNGGIVLPRLLDGYMKESMQGRSNVGPSNLMEETPPLGAVLNSTSPARFSWLQKCKSIFKLSPGKRLDEQVTNQEKSPSDVEADADQILENDSGGLVSGGANYDEPEISVGIQISQAVDFHRRAASPESIGRGDEEETVVTPSAADGTQSDMLEMQEGPSASAEISHPSAAAGGRARKKPRRGAPKLTRRTRSVKDVVKESKAILGESSEELKTEEEEESAQANVDSKGQPIVKKGGRKRQHPTTSRTMSEQQQDADSQSESVTRGRSKRRQIEPSHIQPPGGRRYNLRHSTLEKHVENPVGSQALASKVTTDADENHSQHVTKSPGEMVEGQTSNHIHPDEPSIESLENAHGGGEAKTDVRMLQHTKFESIVEIHREFSTQKVIMIETGGALEETDVNDPGPNSSEQEPQANQGANDLLEYDEDGGGSGSRGGEDDDGNDDDDDGYVNDENQEASIGKKLWTFFTT